MSSQRYSLSAQLTHIVCSRRHLLALLSVMAGSVDSLLFASPDPGPCENAHSWSWLGTDWKILTTKDGCFLSREKPPEWHRIGVFCKPEAHAGSPQEGRAARSLERFFLFWARLSSLSGHTY